MDKEKSAVTPVAPSRTVEKQLDNAKSRPSPGLTKEQILQSIYQKPIGPVKGRPIVGAGGYKPFRPPPEGTKARPFKLSPFKPLRPPPSWSK